MLRAAVIGARRQRQGIGEYVARELGRSGCEVTAIVGTRPETVAEAQAMLNARYGLECRGYLSLDALLADEPVDIIAICSPAVCHLRHLQEALAAGAHVLCEKPLWWPAEALDPARVERRTAELVAGFADRRRRLATVTQWPFVLPVFYELFPEAAAEPVEALYLRLGPIGRGAEMVIDSGSHLLSMLHALVGLGRIEGLSGRLDAAGEALRLRFDYRHRQGATRVELDLRHSPAPPRPAEIGLNGRSMSRYIELPAYRLYFEAAGRRIPIEDPLALTVREFVRCVEEDEDPLMGRYLVERLGELHHLVGFTRTLEATPGVA